MMFDVYFFYEGSHRGIGGIGEMAISAIS